MSRSLLHLALLWSMAAAGCADDGTTYGTTPTPTDTTDAARAAADATDAGTDAVGESDAAIDAPNTTDAPMTTDAPNPTDAGADGDDAEPDASRDARDAADADAEASADTADANDDRSDSDAGDVLRDTLADALVCPISTVVAYNQPGCGANAPPPYCQGSTDACLGPVCGCDGVTTATGCGYATSPFAAWGACPDGGLRDGAVE